MPDLVNRHRPVGDLEYGTPVDLSNCEREPIHIPGQIQAHGVLLALNAARMVVLQASDNTLGYLGVPVEEVLGRGVAELLGEERAADLHRILTTESLDDSPLFLFPALVCGAGPFHVIGHVHEGLLVLELELPPPPGETRPDFYELIKRGVSRFQSARTVREFSQLVVEEVRRVSGYDRVMVYQFAHDWSGYVVAESMDPSKGLESYLGLHYPASDIPAQARALFLLNTVRMLPDARYVPSRLVPEINPHTGKPLDLSYTFLRGASQMYTEYLTNMGVRASLTLAIAKGDWMWGMLVCHHYAPRQIPYDVRAACELLARFVSVQMADKQVQEEEAYRRRAYEALDAVEHRLATDGDLEEGLLGAAPDLAVVVERAAVAVVTGGRCRLLGDTPSESQVLALCDWLSESDAGEVFATDALGTLYPPAEEFLSSCCGLLAVRVSRTHREYVLWMRPELIRTERWAGDPNKPVETGPFGDRLTPRKSFALWQETVRGRSPRFSSLELELAGRLRFGLAETLMVRSEKLARAAYRSRSLLEMAVALAAARTEEEVVKEVLERGLKVTGARSVFLDRPSADGRFLQTDGRGVATPVASLEAEAFAEMAPAAELPADRDLPFAVEQAVRESRLVLSPSGAGELASDGRGARVGARATLPLGDAQSPIGAVCFVYPSPRSFKPEDEEFLLTLSRMCGQALQRARLADQALRASEAYRGSLVDSLSDHVAVLDPSGVIVEVNQAWQRFAEEGGGDPRACGVGANYLEACERTPPGPDQASALETARGIREVIGGRRERFGLEYPCHCPPSRRWFALRVSRAAGRDPGSVVISHSDVTTIKRAEEQLREALTEKDKLVREVHEQNLRVEEANRHKSGFLANMSHELRTPLNGIIGFSELLADGKAGPLSEVQREYLGDVLDSARHLHHLINDVLDLSKVEAGKLAFHPEPADLSALLHGARDALRALIGKKRIAVAIEVDPGLGEVVLDTARFKQVIFNYLSNALKFTAEGGRVQLRLLPAGEERFRLEVEDNGIGIKPADMARLFVEFQQLDGSTAKRFAGTGLGLALTRRIVEAQGGEVGATSEPGVGSTFFAVLPRRPGEARAPTGRPGGATPTAQGTEDTEGTPWSERQS